MNHILIQSQKKEHLNQEQEKGFRELPSGTKQIKQNTNGIKTGSSKTNDLLKI